ncbi:GNAT family N-acetyltransferase [Hyphobacterium marinum]|uniref:GNAT family N-acetyltransferase n=1 Tax=Hyphobacterium marinum TaxID=3116574 RepID=A0ABU7LWU0_9PROT|nr:GNAT family N-acetyltransferase [Hyphobacterium sp. Y6023]MEE2565989.1 GNAT family N-acetyltransferase [Hyphobacterium sp. Y6023]
MAHDIHRQDDGTRGRFFIILPDHAEAALVYSKREGVWSADSTRVPEAYGGRGIAGELVEALVAAARKEKVKIRPACSYVAHWFEKHPDHADLLA